MGRMWGENTHTHTHTQKKNGPSLIKNVWRILPRTYRPVRMGAVDLGCQRGSNKPLTPPKWMDKSDLPPNSLLSTDPHPRHHHQQDAVEPHGSHRLPEVCTRQPTFRYDGKGTDECTPHHRNLFSKKNPFYRWGSRPSGVRRLPGTNAPPTVQEDVDENASANPQLNN